MASLSSLASLALVLAILGGALWWLRRRELVSKSQGTAIQIVGAVAVGPRDRVLLLETDGQRVLVAVGAQGPGSMVLLPRPLPTAEHLVSPTPSEPNA